MSVGDAEEWDSDDTDEGELDDAELQARFMQGEIQRFDLPLPCLFLYMHACASCVSMSALRALPACVTCSPRLSAGTRMVCMTLSHV